MSENCMESNLLSIEEYSGLVPSVLLLNCFCFISTLPLQQRTQYLRVKKDPHVLKLCSITKSPFTFDIFNKTETPSKLTIGLPPQQSVIATYDPDARPNALCEGCAPIKLKRPRQSLNYLTSPVVKRYQIEKFYGRNRNCLLTTRVP